MDTTETRVIQTFVRRIVRLAPRVTQPRFLDQGPQGFINLQSEIATLQRDIQSAINTAKKAVRVDKSRLDELRDLRSARWYSKRLGDALAWLVFLFDRKTLFALAENTRTPSSASSEDDGSRGVLLTAQNLLNQRWGLPIIHDITDCLRIGDISLLSFGETVDDRHVRTIEVKTKRTAIEPQLDGSDVLHLQITMISTEPLYESGGDGMQAPEPPTVAPQPLKWRDDRRLDKQVKRMRRAMEHRDVENDVIAELDGNPHMSLLTGVQDVHHWTELRRAIREARRGGYAFFAVDEFIGYSIHYNSAGITTGDLGMGSLVDDIVKSIFVTDLDDRNSITINQIPAKEDNDRAPFILPFYLYDIPRRAIRELVEGKLVIMAYMNAGRVEHALAEAGFKVEPEHRDGADLRSFKVRTTLTWPDGSASVEIPAPWQDMLTAMHEFYGIESVVSKVEAIRDIPNKIPFAAFEESWRKADVGVVA